MSLQKWESFRHPILNVKKKGTEMQFQEGGGIEK